MMRQAPAAVGGVTFSHAQGSKRTHVGSILRRVCTTETCIQCSRAKSVVTAVRCLIATDSNSPGTSGHDWNVRLAERWDAVKSLSQVSSLATDVFYDSEGFEPIINVSKLLYKLELFVRLGWRIGKLNSTSCLAIAHGAVPQVLAGVLEMSIQTDIPVDLSGSRQAAVVTTMAVLPSMQRQGIGTALLDAAQDWAASLDIRIVALFVYRDNDAAIRLYERIGFERVVKWVDPVWLACAEKGVIGPTRRVLYIRQLPGKEAWV